MKSIVRNLIVEALKEVQKSGELNGEIFPDIVIEEPRDSKLGDFSTTVAMTLAKSERKNPKVIAEVICKELKNGKGWIESVETAGPGFINLKMTPIFYQDRLRDVIAKGEDFGRSTVGENQKVNLEFVSANPTGPLHVGHGRGAAIGDTLGNILKWAGFNVTKEYYINNVGNQIKTLGQSTWLRYRELLGESIDFPEDHYRGEYIKDIAREIKDQHSSRFLNEAEEGRQGFFMEYANDHVLEGIKKDLSKFRVGHDIWFSEKSLYDDFQVDRALDWLRKKNFIYDKDGAMWLKSSAFKDEKDRVIVKQTGEKTYFCSDIAYHKNKIDRGFEKIVDIWGADHHGYVPRMEAVLEAMEYDKKLFKVILVQFVSLKRGGEKVQMSTRSGEFVTLADVVSEVGVDAARFFFLMRGADSHLDFDLELAKKETPENPVYYIQYAHARICNIFETARERGIDCEKLEQADLGLLQDEDLALIKKMMLFPEVIEKSALALEVHRLPFYLQDLASAFHSFYKRNRIVTEDFNLTRSRLILIQSILRIFKNGLTLMGVSAPEKM